MPKRRGAKPDPSQSEMTLTEHLAELRVRIIRSSLALLVGMLVVLAFYDHVLHWMLKPFASLCASQPDPESYCGGSWDPETKTVRLINLDPIEGLSTRLRIAFYGGIVLALPVLLWQIWKFIVPALHKHERKYAVGFVSSSIVLFLLGGVIAMTTLEKALQFLINWAGEDVAPAFQVQAYVRLVTLMFVAFGVGFITPVLLVFLELVGVVTPRTLLRGWRYATVGIVAVAAAITPSGDPISLAALSVPMVILYFGAIGVGALVLRRRRRAAET
jgi:sec-independent protein translocase protein TatC